VRHPRQASAQATEINGLEKRKFAVSIDPSVDAKATAADFGSRVSFSGGAAKPLLQQVQMPSSSPVYTGFLTLVDEDGTFVTTQICGLTSHAIKFENVVTRFQHVECKHCVLSRCKS
jgi:hypothetical protein